MQSAVDKFMSRLGGSTPEAGLSVRSHACVKSFMQRLRIAAVPRLSRMRVRVCDVVRYNVWCGECVDLQVSLYRCRRPRARICHELPCIAAAQTGPISESEIEDLVVSLHEIEVSGLRCLPCAGAPCWPATEACAKPLLRVCSAVDLHHLLDFTACVDLSSGPLLKE